MRFFEPMWIAISTYSVLPAPRFDWNEKNMRFSICFLPLVGLIIGAALYLWARAAKALAVDGILFAAVAAALPILLTGGIHMDGFMDTVDALASHREREKKLAILKDPHTGAFAVVYCGVYLVLSFGLYHALFQTEGLLIVCFGFVLSRALAVLGAVTLPNARKEGMLCAFTGHAHKRVVSIAMAAVALLAMGGMVWASPAAGGFAAGFALLTFFAYRAMAIKEFGGVTGDTTGFFLQTSELALLLGAWIGGLV
ncbi:MAG TPA: adenosylcobinamide-GDP ribazoletransferase [Feifaniaceae bacterium]|nr:adenosylcobinamide-GDP ribazoletransferase [Feifaniaceae bacterium]